MVNCSKLLKILFDHEVQGINPLKYIISVFILDQLLHVFYFNLETISVSCRLPL